MEPRERLLRTVAGESTDRSPAVLWRHWPGDDQRAADLASATHYYQERHQWDLMVVAPTPSYMVTGYGVQDVWEGHPNGTRTIRKRPIRRSLHWTELRPQDPTRGELGKQLDCLRLLAEMNTTQAPTLITIYSPLTQATQLAGRDQLLRNLRTHPDRVRTGLNTLTETTLQFIESLARRTTIIGIVYIAEMATFSDLADDEYAQFGVPYDTKILGTLPRDWWFTLVQVRGESPMLHHFTRHPVQAIGWSDRDGHPSLERAILDFDGAYYGGLGAQTHLHDGTPTTVREATRQAVNIMRGRRLIVGCGDVIPITTPISNLRAVQDAVKTT